MSRNFEHSAAERLGRNMGRACRVVFRLQAGCRRALVRAGLSIDAANVLIALGWLAVAAAVIHYGLWIAAVVLLGAFLIASRIADIPTNVADEPEWRQGYSGFGRYDKEGFRVDPHDPDRVS